MTCVESLENILHQIGLQGRTVLLWSVVLATMADFVKYRLLYSTVIHRETKNVFDQIINKLFNYQKSFTSLSNSLTHLLNYI